MSRRFGWFAALVFGIGLGCAEPDSVELGEICREQVECKAPADTCLTVGVQSRCSMTCTKKDRCPEDFVCARMDVAVQQSGETTQQGRAGYCLPRSAVPANVATL
jgi:hypothetical protein